MSKFIARDTGVIRPNTYTHDIHGRNLEQVRAYVGALGVSTDSNPDTTTPWMITAASGLAAVRASRGSYTAQIVEKKPAGLYGPNYLLGEHLVRHTVRLDSKGIDANSDFLLTRFRYPGFMFLSQSISVGMLMGYPSIAHKPIEASNTLATHLQGYESQVKATPELTEGLFSTWFNPSGPSLNERTS